ncbi:hypothetical protein LTR37_018482 [Vermiconidia calcicola]|uniref:Uncharacterized protein n=1 Tax=Vermiconidia calcicola TaxID=1690605 RepID=A0ACC3MI08_9PEZI|nr:hypothetical protein LTR37_018482 [Vermiconidia calcicola]
MARFACLVALLGFLSGLAKSDHPENGVDRFITRPDIVSPRWEVKYYDKDAITPGYWFLAPYEKVGEREPGGAWIGPAIYDGDGGLIWSGSYIWNNINIMDFQMQKVRGEDRLTLMFPVEGDGIILDNHYREVDRTPVGITGKTLNMHEFHFVENGASLLLLKRNITKASKEMSKAVGYDGECQIMFVGIEEIDTANWDTKFTWTSEDWITLDESTLDTAPAEKRCKNSWDYLHANALDKFTDGHYLLSARHADTIYKVDKDDGHIHWRLGGRNSDFEMGNLNFSRQHHARFRYQNETHTVISLLDNSKGQDPQPPTSGWSRALLITLRTDTDPMTAEIMQAFDHPRREYAWRRGNYQMLDNGNAFICWSEQSLQSEHAPDGKLLFEAQMEPHWIGTYRAFKHQFVGLPLDPPDVYAQAFNHEEPASSTSTLVHVSWNGATEVATWNLYKSTEDGETMLKIASKPRSGFETALEYDGFASYVVVEAVNKDRVPIGQSEIFKTIHSEDMSTPAVATEIQWLEEVGGSLPEESWTSHAKNVAANPIATFFAGVIASAVVVFVVWRFRQKRGSSSWRLNLKRGTYAPLGEGDAAAYDETKLDDMNNSNGHSTKNRDSGEQFSLNDDEEVDDEPAPRDAGRLNGRIPYVRQISSTV